MVKEEELARDYLHDGEYRLSLEEKQIGKEVGSPNKEYALEYVNRLRRKKDKPRTIAARLKELRFILKALEGKDAKQVTRKDIDQLIRAIDTAKIKDTEGRLTHTPMAAVSRRKLKLTLKAFYKSRFEVKGKEYPDLVADIQPGNDEDSLKKPEQMLSEEEVKLLINNCRNQRDKAIIACCWEGLRAGEIQALTCGDCKIDGEIAYLAVIGKTGRREVPATFALAYISNYLEAMRKNADPSDPFFVVLHNGVPTNKQFEYEHLRKMLGDVEARTRAANHDFKKHVTAQIFRASRATHLVKMQIHPEIMKRYFGWTERSNIAYRYARTDVKAVADAMSKLSGHNIEEKKPTPQFKVCLKCKAINEITATYCKCGYPLDPQAQIKQSEEMQARMSRMENLIDKLYQRLDEKTKREVEAVKV